MNKALKTVLSVVLLIALISTVSYCSAPFDTETAHVISTRKTISGTGYILRREKLVEQSSNGVFEQSIKDGVRVSRGSSVGVAISGNLKESLVKELEEVTRRIKEIQESDSFADIYASDEARIFSALKNLTSSIREDARAENYASAHGNTLQLSTLLEKKFSAENKGAAAQLLVSLEEEKYELEQQLGGIREEVRAPSAGYFYSSPDGLETTANERDLQILTTTKIGKYPETLKSYTPPANCVGKIVDTYTWYLAAIVDESEAQKLSVGETVNISIDEGTDVMASVLAINPDKSGRAALIIKCSRDITGIYEKRNVEFEICYEEYDGIYVPAAAIRVVDDVTGVYVINQNKSVSFKCVHILLQEEDYYIVSRKYTPPEEVKYSPLKVYDNILVNPEAVI